MAADDHERAVTRRQALAASGSATAALVLVACGGSDKQTTVAGEGGRLEPTPSCGEGGSTPEQTEGPFFAPSSPQRTNLVEAGVTGTSLMLTGRVLGTDCRPIPGALLDFWQADDGGVYDNDGYRLRGHQFASGNGRYRLATIVPGVYPGRTRHIHVKVQPRGAAVLTTQLYFPGEEANEADGIFDPALLIDAQGAVGGLVGSFDFVLES